MTPLLAALLIFSPIASAKYDTGEDRAALLRHANACYAAADAAAGTSLEPAKIGVIKADLDQSVAEAGLAETAAKSLETAGELRSAEMDNSFKGTDDAAKAATDGAAAARARWKKDQADQDQLKARADALPNEKPAGTPNPDKAHAKESLDKAAAALIGADGNLLPAESGAAGMTTSADQMKSARGRAKGPAAERKAADDEAVSAADALPPAAADAKGAVDQLGQEPQAANRTRAGDKLSAVREVARRLLAAADRAGHRDEDFTGVSAAFDRALGGYQDAQKAGDGKTDAAKALLDQPKRPKTTRGTAWTIIKIC